MANVDYNTALRDGLHSVVVLPFPKLLTTKLPEELKKK